MRRDDAGYLLLLNDLGKLRRRERRMRRLLIALPIAVVVWIACSAMLRADMMVPDFIHAGNSQPYAFDRVDDRGVWWFAQQYGPNEVPSARPSTPVSEPEWSYTNPADNILLPPSDPPAVQPPTPSPVPEPGTLILLGTGVAMIVAAHRRHK